MHPVRKSSVLSRSGGIQGDLICERLYVCKGLSEAALQVAFVLILPVLFQINGIWMSIIMAELCALIITMICLLKNRDRYQYA